MFGRHARAIRSAAVRTSLRRPSLPKYRGTESGPRISKTVRIEVRLSAGCRPTELEPSGPTWPCSSKSRTPAVAVGIISTAAIRLKEVGGYVGVHRHRCRDDGAGPQKHDRVVEIGLVYVSHSGDVLDQWSTLVNPGRDVGPTHIHGVAASDVHEAPTFLDIAPYVLRAVSGRTIVAHNVTFDLRFLAAEMVRAGIPLTELPLSGVCTMRWAPAFLRSASRRLVDCCRAGGVKLDDAHLAGADALATAQLLSHFLDRSAGRPPWAESLTKSGSYPWPPFGGPFRELRLVRRTDVRARRSDEWSDRVVSRMPRSADARVDSYLAVLERAMLDGFLAEAEKDELVDVALSCGITRGQVLDIQVTTCALSPVWR